MGYSQEQYQAYMGLILIKKITSIILYMKRATITVALSHNNSFSYFSFNTLSKSLGLIFVARIIPSSSTR